MRETVFGTSLKLSDRLTLHDRRILSRLVDTIVADPTPETPRQEKEETPKPTTFSDDEIVSWLLALPGLDPNQKAAFAQRNSAVVNKGQLNACIQLMVRLIQEPVASQPSSPLTSPKKSPLKAPKFIPDGEQRAAMQTFLDKLSA